MMDRQPRRRRLIFPTLLLSCMLVSVYPLKVYIYIEHRGALGTPVRFMGAKSL